MARPMRREIEQPAWSRSRVAKLVLAGPPLAGPCQRHAMWLIVLVGPTRCRAGAGELAWAATEAIMGGRR
jgi:hypothetical protein